MGIHAEWVETLLKKHTKGKSIARIISMETNPATSKGDNYTSDIFRIKMKVVLGSGKNAERSILVKKMSESEDVQKLVAEFSLFKVEILVYGSVLPAMTKLMDDHGDKRNPIWCECLGTVGHDEIILEDLKESGFRTADRMEGQDLAHALLVTRNIGRFHAMSYMLKQNEMLDVSPFGQYVLTRDSEHIDKMFKGALTTLIDVIKTTWGPTWLPYVSKIEAFQEKLSKVLQNLGMMDESRFNVLNHGDCWTNNMLFKYDPESNIPMEIRFVDFQICHFNSFAWDLTYYFSSSVKPSIRKEKLDQLLESYRFSLLTTLRIMGGSEEVVPSIQDMKKELTRLSPMAFALECTILPVTMAKKENAMDLGKLFDKESDGQSAFNKGMFMNESYSAVIKEDIKYFAEIGVLR